MNTYISNAACRGIRPKGLVEGDIHTRRFLIARMLKQRDVARMLVAPAGFGKTVLADQYAQLLFSYWHVFWFDCQDLRFIRGLSEGALFHDVLERDDQAALVVFDDVPLLNADQVKRFAEGIEQLLENGCEVVVTCTPVSASFLDFDALRTQNGGPLVLDARMLLAQSSELGDKGEKRLHAQTPFARNVLGRIPQLAWGAQDGIRLLMQGFCFDELSSSQSILGLTLFSLGSGSLSEVEPLFGDETRSLLETLATDYPYFSFDFQAETFESIACSDDLFHQTVLPLMDEELALLDPEERRALCEGFVQALFQASKGRRACAAACELMPYAQREAWLQQRGMTLILEGNGDAFEKAASALAEYRSEGSTIKALREFGAVLSGKGVHVSSCIQALEQGEGPLEARCLFGVLLLRCNERAIRGELEERLTSLNRAARSYDGASVAVELFRFSYQQRSSYSRALKGWSKEACGPKASFGVTTMIEALWLAEAQVKDDSLPGRDEVTAYLKRMMKEEANALPLLREGARKALSLMKPGNAAQMPSRIEYQSLSIPQLRITFWGSFEVSVGSRVVDPHCFTRRKSLTLLALLAAEAGHDVARDRLVEMLWPESTLSQGRHNLYVVWADLRQTLTLSDGTCPYLVRAGQCYRVDTSFVSCDVVEVRNLLRILQAHDCSSADLASALDNLVARFGGEPIPDDFSNDEINRFRRLCCTEVVDALVVAATGLCRRGEWQLALRFAREAMDRSRDREDAYAVAMQAQMALGQRTSALETYFACQRVLSQQLGIDPSARITSLYEKALEDETPQLA